MIILLVLLVFPWLAWGQPTIPTTPPFGSRGPLSAAPACGAGLKGWVHILTDAASVSDCTVGSGTDVNDCICNGTLYEDTDNASGGGAPTDSPYWTGAADGTLSAEVVVNSEASLEAAIGAVDLAVAADLATTQAAAEATAAGELAGHAADTTNVHGLADTSTVITGTAGTEGNCVAWGAAGAIADAGGPCNATDDQTAAEVVFTPDGTIAATDVQAALSELDTEKVPTQRAATALTAADATPQVSCGQIFYKSGDETVLTDFVDADGDHSDFTAECLLYVVWEHEAGLACDTSTALYCNNETSWASEVGDTALCVFQVTNAVWSCTVTNPSPPATEDLAATLAVGKDYDGATSLAQAVRIGNGTWYNDFYVDGAHVAHHRVCNADQSVCNSKDWTAEVGDDLTVLNENGQACETRDSVTGAITLNTVGTCVPSLTSAQPITGSRLCVGGTTCLGVSADQIFHDTNSDGVKDAGEEWIDIPRRAPASVTAATYTLLATDCGGWVRNSDADALEVDLLADMTGCVVCFQDAGGGAITLDPNGTDQFNANVAAGVAPAAGEAIVLAAGTGNNVCLGGVSATTIDIFTGNAALTEETP